MATTEWTQLRIDVETHKRLKIQVGISMATGEHTSMLQVIRDMLDEREAKQRKGKL